MKTPKEWMEELHSEDHSSDFSCICDRCKNGKETFLLESDIKAIQDDAIHSFKNHKPCSCGKLVGQVGIRWQCHDCGEIYSG